MNSSVLLSTLGSGLGQKPEGDNQPLSFPPQIIINLSSFSVSEKYSPIPSGGGSGRIGLGGDSLPLGRSSSSSEKLMFSQYGKVASPFLGGGGGGGDEWILLLLLLFLKRLKKKEERRRGGAAGCEEEGE